MSRSRAIPLTAGLLLCCLGIASCAGPSTRTSRTTTTTRSSAGATTTVTVDPAGCSPVAPDAPAAVHVPAEVPLPPPGESAEGSSSRAWRSTSTPSCR
jgi:hypothetical protein